MSIISKKQLPTAHKYEFEIIRTNKEFVNEKYLNNIELSQDIKDLILSMIDENPKNRPTAQKIIEKVVTTQVVIFQTAIPE